MRPTNRLQLLAASGIVALAAAGCASQGGVSRDSLNSTMPRKVQVICDH